LSLETASPARTNTVRSDSRALRAILRKTERAIGAPVILEGALWYAVMVAAVLLSALAVAAIFPNFAARSMMWILGLGIGLTSLLGVVSFALFSRRRGDVYQVARTLQRHHREFRNDLVAALEFSETLSPENGEDVSAADQGFSPSLATAHIRRTTARVVELCEGGHLGHLVPRRGLTPPILALTGATVLLAIPFVFFWGWTWDALGGSLKTTMQQVVQRTHNQPIVGPIDVVFSYPVYTGMERQHFRGTSGYIETLVGTEITLQTYAMDADLESIELVLETSDGTQIFPLQRGNGRDLHAKFVAGEGGTYQFQAVRGDGTKVMDGIERPFRVREDEAPRVQVTSHERELEVRPEDILDLSFEIVDDFGVASVDLVYHFDGAEEDLERKRIDLPQLAGLPRAAEGEVEFDLRSLNLQPKDSVVVYIEARDNNNVTGPGIGRSQPLILYVSSPEDKHLENIADQQALMEALLLHLADFLESPVGARQLRDKQVRDKQTYVQVVDDDPELDERRRRFTRIDEIHRQRGPLLDEMEKIAERLSEDPLMVNRNLTLFQGLYEQLRSLQADGNDLLGRLQIRVDARALTTEDLQRVADYASRSEDKLEKGILRLEELLASQKMEAIQATAQDIKDLKDRLRELLEQYRDSQDPELKAAIKREIQRLRQRMAELMARMQMQLQKLPQEHVNMEALRQAQLESETRQMADQLQNIEDMLENDDIDGALAALDEMDASLDALTQEMGDQFSNAEPQGLSEMDKKMGELMDEVNDLEQLERSIEQDTRALQDELTQKQQERTERMLKPFTDEMLKQIAEQEKLLKKIDERGLPQRDRPMVDDARRKLQSLKEMVEQQDIEMAADRARSSLDSLRALRQTLNLSQRYTPSDSDEHGELSEAMSDVGKAIPRGERIVEDLERTMEQAQSQMQPRERQRLEELADRQRQASERASEFDQRLQEATEQFPQLGEQLRPSLEEAQQSMEEAEESLRQSQVQRGLDQERQALDQLGRLRQQMRQSLQRQRQQEQRDGQGRQRQDRVEIPTQDSREGQEKFRREMMDGMREGRLENYESEIERYYRSLVE
ncbi:MAG: DUF4175 family protein, partial [Bradymonadaceae bacterium]